MFYDWPNQVVVDPNDSKVVFAASNGYWRGNGTGDIYRSTDGGFTWKPSGLDIGLWNGVHVFVRDSRVVLAAGEKGIWRSTDGGSTWSQALSADYVLNFTADPTAPDTVYAGSYGSGIFRSTDRGVTWHQISVSPSNNIRTVAVHSQNGQIVFAASYDEGVYRSRDYGASWTMVQSFEVWGVASAPTDGDTVCAVGGRFGDFPKVYLSRDGGDTWKRSFLPTENYFAPFAMRAAFDPADADTIYVGMYRGGVFKTTDGGASWNDANRGLGATVVDEIIAHPNRPWVIWAGTMQTGLQKSVDGGRTWHHSGKGWSASSTSKFVTALALDPGDPDHLLLGGSTDGVWQSFNGGESWSPTGLQSHEGIAEITFSPTRSNVVWAACDNQQSRLGLYKSVDGGSTWTNTLPGLAVKSASVHPLKTDVVIATTSSWFWSPTVYSPATIERSTDGGLTWTTVYTQDYGQIPDSEFSPANPDLVWGTSLQEKVLKSVDGGVTWESNYGGFIPAGGSYVIVADPLSAKIAYLTSNGDTGPYYTRDGGEHWKKASANLWFKSAVPVHVLHTPRWGRRFYYLGTLGTGAFAAWLK